MRIAISSTTVCKLCLMLGDYHRMDVGHPKEDQIWGDFNCVGIIEDLMSANKHRSNDGTIDVSQETISWMSVVLENLLADE